MVWIKKDQLMLARSVKNWLILVYFFMKDIMFIEVYHRKYYKNCLFSFLSIFIPKNTKAHFRKHERII